MNIKEYMSNELSHERIVWNDLVSPSLGSKIKCYLNKLAPGTYVTLTMLSDPSKLLNDIDLQFKGKSVNTIMPVLRAFKALYQKLTLINGESYEIKGRSLKVIKTEWDSIMEEYGKGVHSVESVKTTNDEVSFPEVMERTKRFHRMKWEKLKNLESLNLLELWSVQAYVVVLLYEENVLRNDYRLLKFKNFNSGDNWIEKLEGKWYMDIHEFKTKHNEEYHITKKELPQNIGDCLDVMIRWRKNFEGDWLFVKQTCVSMWTSTQWSEYLQNLVFGGKISSRQLRHMNSTHINSDLPSTEELLKRSTSMQHSWKTHVTVYRTEK